MRRGRPTRRAVLCAVGSATASIAGCTDLGSSGNESSPSNDRSAANGSEDGDDGSTGAETDGQSDDDGEEEPTEETPAVTSIEEPWPQARFGPRKTGARPDSSGPSQLSEIWSVDLGAVPIGAPVVADDVVVGVTGAASEDVHALDAGSGDTLWTANTGAIVQTEPVVADERVFVCGSSGEIYAIDTANESAGEVESVFSGPTITGAPGVADGVLYFGDSDGILWSLDPVADEYRWTNGAIGGAIRSPTTVDGGTCYAGSESGDLKAYETADGDDEWRMLTDEPIRGAPSVADDRIVVGNTEGTVYGGPTENGGEDLVLPDPTWTASVPGAVETAIPLVDGTAFVADASGTVTALDASDGSTIWTFEADGDAASHPPAVANGTVYFHAGGSELFSIDAASGDTVDDTDVGESLTGAPTVADGTLYVFSESGVHAFSGE